MKHMYQQHKQYTDSIQMTACKIQSSVMFFNCTTIEHEQMLTQQEM